MSIIDGFRRRLADSLLADDRKKLNEAFGLVLDAYEQGPRTISPRMLEQSIKELDSQWLEFIARQIRNRGFAIHSYIGTEADRLLTVQQSMRAYQEDVLTEACIDIWTDFGFGVQIEVKPRDEAAVEYWDAFWTSPYNSYLLGQNELHRLSTKVLVEGDFFFVYYISTLDGEVRVRVVNTDEIKGGIDGDGIITHPDDSSVPVFYRRQFGSQDATKPTKVQYLRDYRADDKMVADVKKSGVDMSDGDEMTNFQPKTLVLAQPVMHRVRGSRGWPLLTTGMKWSSNYADILHDRMAIQRAAATYLDKVKIKGGQRAVDLAKQLLQSSLANSSNSYERQPNPAAGSDWIENEAVERSRLSMNTGASDAAQDSASVLGQALLAARIYPHWAGRGEAFRLATATSMEMPTLRAFNRYQQFWSATFSAMASIILKAAEKYAKGSPEFETYDVDVNTDALLKTDVNEAVSVFQAVKDAAESQQISVDQAAAVVPQLIRILLQGLGVRNVQDILPNLTPAESDAAAHMTYQSEVSESGKPKGKRGGTSKRKSIVAVNDYQSTLDSYYQTWAEGLAEKLVGASDDEIEDITEDEIALLIAFMIDQGRREIPSAMSLGLGKEPFTPDALGKLSGWLGENERYWRENFGPALKDRIVKSSRTEDIKAAVAAGTVAGVLAYRSIMLAWAYKVAQQAGAWWRAYNYGAMTGQRENERLYWQLDDLAQHCDDCLVYGNRTYKSMSDLLTQTGGKFPGNGTQCGNNDRCEVIRVKR